MTNSWMPGSRLLCMMLFSPALCACTELRNDDADTAADGGGERDAGAREVALDAALDAQPTDVGPGGDGDGDGDGDAGDAHDDGGDAGDGDGGDAAGIDYPPLDFCADILQGICHRYRVFMNQPLIPCAGAGPYGFFSGRCDASLDAAVAAGRLRYHAARAKACAMANALTGNVLSWPPPVIAGIDLCQDVFEGLVPNGGDCYSTALGGQECADGFCRAQDSCPGTCTPYAGEGEPCDALDLCGPGTFCDSDTARCVARAKAGESCATRPCEAGTFCENDLCTARKKDGQPCSFFSQCEHSCAPFKPPVFSGLCATAAGPGDDCQFDAQCAFPLFCVLGQCAAESPDEECQDNEGCGEGKYCLLPDTYRECHALLLEGEECGGAIPCQSGVCGTLDASPSRCFAPGTQGDDCSPTVACAQDYYCGATSKCEPRGAVADPCTGEQECMQGLGCVWAGTCQERAQALGGPCSPYDRQGCADGLFCDRADHTCQPLRGEGEQCNTLVRQGCIAGLYCGCSAASCADDPGTPSVNEICIEQLPNNAVCTFSEQCASGYCAGTCMVEPVQPLTCRGPV